ncbi:hypothetical protein M8J77_011943 [Diaphorina citri]|nr:hypothetical protein M8J77_011943 [Diaphorina citri]
MYAAAGGASIARRQDRRKVAKHHVAADTVQEQIDKRFAQLQDQFAPGHGAPPGILANASRLPSYLELNGGKFGFGSTDVIEGKATSAWTGERRLTSPSEDLERTCKVKQTEAHRRWMKRNRIQDSSFGGGSSSDEEDHIHSGRHHLYIQQQNSLINLLLYIGLCIISLGLIISFVGTGEKGFKTNELRLIGPCLLLVGSIFCGLRVLFCFCRVNSKFCMKKSNHHHQQFIKAHQSKQAKIISNQIQPNKESSQHHVGLIDDKAGSNLEFYKFLPFHNRTNEFVSEPMTKSSDFDGRKRVSIIPPSKSQSSELNKTLMFNPNQLIPYPVPAPVPVRLPKTVPIPSPSSGNDKKQEESTNLIDLNYSASMHDLLSLSSIEEDMEGNADNIDRISINSVTMKQLKSTIITLDNNDSSGIEYSNVINNSFEDLNYNEHNLPLTGVDLNRIESNDFSVINSDIIHNSSCDKKCDNDRYEKKNDIVLNQLTNHDRSLSSPFKNDYTVNNLSEDTIAHNISDDSKIENLKKSEQGRQNDSRDDCKNSKTNLTSQSNEKNAESIEKSKSNESITKKPIRETITLNAKQNEIHRNTNFIDNSSSKIQDNRESKLTYSKDTKLNSLVDKAKTRVKRRAYRMDCIESIHKKPTLRLRCCGNLPQGMG